MSPSRYGEPRPCEYCGDDFVPWNNQPSRWCSRKCYDTARRSEVLTRTTKKCATCGELKQLDEFYKNVGNLDGLINHCKGCYPGMSRRAYLKKHYGLTADDFDRMMAAQENLCLICRDREPRHVDHDHATGVVRGLLCTQCNQGLGFFGDDPQRLLDAATYLLLSAIPTPVSSAL